MSKIVVYNNKKDKIINCHKYDINELKNIIKEKTLSLFGITFIGMDLFLSINSLSNDNIKAEILGYDESFRLVIFEFRQDKHSTLVRSSFFTIDYIKENVGRVKTILKSNLSSNIIKNIDFNPRLIVIGEEFSSYDEYAIKQTPYEVDLVKCIQYNDLLLVEKMYQSYKVNIIDFKALYNKSLFKLLHERIISLGDDIISVGNGSFISYRRIKNVCYLVINNNTINISIRVKQEIVNFSDVKTKEIDKVMKYIEKAYEEN